LSSFITACEAAGSFQKSGWLACSSNSSILRALFAMSKTLQQLRDLGVEFGEVGEEFFHDDSLGCIEILGGHPYARRQNGIARSVPFLQAVDYSAGISSAG
jgi:hypothetical protein